jgi:hypothetical protein
MPILLEKDLKRDLPKMYKARQLFKKTTVGSIKKEIQNQISKEEIKSLIKPGMKIAVGVGSRGISNIAKITRTTIDCLKTMGAYPFIVSAMGSHGGGEPDGQKKILSDLGITQQAMGVEVITHLDVIQIGKTENGRPVYFDKTAYESDMTIVINRVKPHTDFNHTIESGICKMLVIGLGNHIGCSQAHESRLSEMGKSIEESVGVVLEKANVGFGIGIVEDAYHNVACIKAISSDRIMVEEPGLLQKAKELMPRILIPEIDLLIIERIGKNISGCGADPNIIGRVLTKKSSPLVPKIQKIIILDLTKESCGNFVGLGLADITLREVFDKLDFKTTYANAIAAKGDLFCCAIPLMMESEREAIIAGIATCFDVVDDQYKIVRIKDTMNLDEIMLSEALLPFARQSSRIKLL